MKRCLAATNRQGLGLILGPQGQRRYYRRMGVNPRGTGARPLPTLTCCKLLLTKVVSVAPAPVVEMKEGWRDR